MERSTGILIIIFSIIVSFIFSISANMEGASLGALINLIWPPFVGLLTILVYLLLWLIVKSTRGRIIITVILSLYNIYVGVALFIGKEYWPLVLY